MSQIVTYIRNIDMRTVMGVIGLLTVIEQAIVGGHTPLSDPSSPLSPAMLAKLVWWCSVAIWVNGFILMGHAGTAAVWSTTSSTVKTALAIFAVLLASLIFVMQPAMAANDGVVLKKPVLTGNIVKDIKANTSAAAPATPASSGDALSNFMAQLEKVAAADITGVIADIQLADNDAATIITPAIVATPAVPANPNATPPTLAVPAFPGSPAVVKDPIAHACYPAAMQFLGSIPAVAAPTGKFIGVQLFQAKRDFIAQLQAGLPNYLKLGCAPLLGDEINIALQVFNMIGIKVAPAALTAIMPALAPITLPAMVLAP